MTNIRVLFLFVLSLTISHYGVGQGRRDSIYAIYYFDKFQVNEYTAPAKARIYVDSALYFAKRSKNNYLLGQAYMYQGWMYQDLSEFKTSNELFYKSLAYFKKTGKTQAIADAYGNLGNSYLDLHEYRKSLDYQLLSLDENEKVIRSKKASKQEIQQAKIGRTYALHNIGDIYRVIGMYNKALEYEWRSMRYELEPNNLEGVGISYTTLGEIHKKMDHVDSAKYYFKKAIALFESDKVNAPYNYAIALHEYATLKNSGLSRKKQDEMFISSLSIREELGDMDGVVDVYLDIAEFKFDELSTDSLSNLLSRSFKLISENPDELGNHEEQYFKVYSRYNSRLGKYNTAYFALENYLELKAVSDEKRRTYDLIAGDIKHQLETKHVNDSLLVEEDRAKERAKYHEDIADVQNIVYLSVIGFIILIVTLGFIISANRRRRRVNLILSEKNELIQEQKAIVEEKNQSISDSINYAKRLQSAILPTKEQINTNFPASFMIFKPKDVVSGDFYWFESKGDNHFIAVADCTGHGVPGAMVSVVCSNALYRSLNEFGLTETNELLDKTREIVIETLGKSGEGVADGMDIALVKVSKSTKQLSYSGAHNALWIVRENSIGNNLIPDLQNDKCLLAEIKGDKQPIGLFSHMSHFTKHVMSYENGDRIYLTSDGYPDQFGGEDGKKFKYRPLKQLILEYQALEMHEQGSMLEATYDNWKGGFDQVDDVCFFGLELS